MNPSGLLAVSRIFLEYTVHLFVYHGIDRSAVIEFATNLMGSGDESRQVIEGGNLILFEQRHKLILLAWVGACRASANNCGGQHHRGANQSVCKAGDAGAHGSDRAHSSALVCAPWGRGGVRLFDIPHSRTACPSATALIRSGQRSCLGYHQG
jgi:hypothetical protein